jgi:hypothetical protein
LARTRQTSRKSWREEYAVARRELADRKIGGMSVGGILVILGIVVALAFSIALGVVIAVIGLAAFGGFVRGKWY